jgi:uncharacterized membrane protein (DUF373 family)
MNSEKSDIRIHVPRHDLHLEHEDPAIRFTHRIIKSAVKVLAILMVIVAVWGSGDVIVILYQRLAEQPFLLLQINDILAPFSVFLAVLIAIEIFINICMYLSSNTIPVRLIIAIALMAIACKVIILIMKISRCRSFMLPQRSF